MKKAFFISLALVLTSTLATSYAVSSDPLSLGLNSFSAQDYRDEAAQTNDSNRFAPMMNLFGEMINEQKQTVRSASSKVDSGRNNILSAIAKVLPFGRRFI